MISLPNAPDWTYLETRHSFTVANNDPGQGTFYIVMLAYEGLDDDEQPVGLIGYDFRLGRYGGGSIEQMGDDVDDPADLLGMVPQRFHAIMGKQIADFHARELPALLGGTMEWDESFEDDDGPPW